MGPWGCAQVHGGSGPSPRDWAQGWVSLMQVALCGQGGDSAEGGGCHHSHPGGVGASALVGGGCLAHTAAPSGRPRLPLPCLETLPVAGRCTASGRAVGNWEQSSTDRLSGEEGAHSQTHLVPTLVGGVVAALTSLPTSPATGY